MLLASLACLTVALSIEPASAGPRTPASVATQVPGNGLIAFTSTRSGDSEIFAMNPDGSAQKDLTKDHGSSDSQPAWSPDGSRIAFTSDRTGTNEIWVMNADGTGQVQLTTDAAPVSDSQPAWSPDGTRIAFTRDPDGTGTNAQILSMNATDGAGQVQLTTDPPPVSNSQPAWSPDGTRIAFTSNRDGNDEVYLMNADGTAQADLTNDPAADSKPAFSPDQGTKVVFQSDRTGDEEIYWTQVPNGSPLQIALQSDLTFNAASDAEPSWQPMVPYAAPATPIQHIVIIYEENHSFDNILGVFCNANKRCDGATHGQLPDGTTMKLPKAKDLVVQAGHDYPDQIAAINGGAMNGWPNVTHCDVTTGYECYQQFVPHQIPTITALATTYALSDRFFELDPVSSWASHLELVASNTTGFYTGDHEGTGSRGARGWGCDSNLVGLWWPASPSLNPTPWGTAPTCVPGLDGAGPYIPSPVPWAPTILNRIDEAGLTWKLYSVQQGGGYGWSICPTFGQCLDGPQRTNWTDAYNFPTDALAGTLPSLSIVTPHIVDSAHNGRFMSRGDNWIATTVNAVMQGPDWSSTAIFITFDDCGCFYDHVPPPAGLGLRLPLLIVSPYAKPAYTDHTVASQGSFQAFIEHVFGLAPLSWRDRNAYDLLGAFNFGQQPLAPIHLTPAPIAAWKIRYDATHPMNPNTPDD